MITITRKSPVNKLHIKTKNHKKELNEYHKISNYHPKKTHEYFHTIYGIK